MAAPALPQSAPAGSPNSAAIAAEVRSNILLLDRSADGVIGGQGWRQLVNDAGQSQFTMVGEQHGSASITEIELQLHRALAAQGYTHAALEIGPHSTKFVEALARRGRSALRSYLEQPGYGFTIPFLFFSEEIPLVEQMVALSPDRTEALWGLDQEFAGSGLLHAELLSRMARTKRQRDAVNAFRSKAAAQRIFIALLQESDVLALRTAFAGDRNALALIDDLRASADIYQPFVKGEAVYAANLARERTMKANFIRAFSAAERERGSPPKVFLQFGGNHAMRGHSATDVPSLGNFLMEWGDSRGFKLINIMIDCQGGEALNAQSGEVAKCAPYFGRDNLITATLLDGPDLQLVHLVPLRAKLARWKDVDETTRQLVLAFDYYFLVRQSRAARPTGQLK